MKLDKYYNQDSQGKKEEQHQPEPETHAESSHSSTRIGAKFDSFIENKYVFIAIAIFILIINIVLRAGLLKFQGFFEPDAFFYYAVVKQAIANHFIVSNYLTLSGFPQHNFIGEAPGLPYITVLLYFVLRVFGLSAIVVMRWSSILFGVLYAILGYFLAKTLSNSRALGLIAMFFISVSSGNIARTAGIVYRGDSFITLFIMLALLLMIKCFDDKRRPFKYLWAILSAVALSLGIVVWNGAPFIMVVYMLAILFAVVYGFIKGDHDVLLTSLVLSITLILMHLLQVLYVSIGIARGGLQLVGNDFFIFYLPIVLGSFAAYYIMRHIHRIRHLSTAKNRIIATLGVGFAVFIIIFALFGSTLINIASPISPSVAPTPTNSSTNNTKSSIGAAIVVTTQELQKPDYNFLWSSFNIQLYLFAIGVALFILFAFLVWQGERFIKRDHFNLNHLAFLALFSYLLVTVYLQSTAIRFNALVSVPLSIFSAFAIYGIGKLFYNYSLKKGIASVAVAAIAVVFIIILAYTFYGQIGSPFHPIFGSLVLGFVVLAALVVYLIYALAKGHLKVKYIVLAIVLALFIFNFYNTYFESNTAGQADGINPQFLQAMIWLKNNTAHNATVLALWPDGSVVEGWGNRTSYMDSVGGENGSRIYPFAQYLFNTSLDTQYLYSIHRPQYLISRNFWYAELGGIAQEGLIQNASAFGYIILSSINATNNGTAQFFTFSTNQYPYYKSELIIQPNPNNSAISKYTAYLGTLNGTRYTLMRNVMFLNTTSSAYNLVNANPANSINYTLLVSYTGRQINGAFILGPKLVESNLFKFTFLCNTFICSYNDSNVSMKAVYVNSDTRILKITYLK